MKLYDFILNYFISIFIDTKALSTPISFLNCTILDVFNILFICSLSFVIIYCFIILPFKVLKRIAGGTKRAK